MPKWKFPLFLPKLDIYGKSCQFCMEVSGAYNEPIVPFDSSQYFFSNVPIYQSQCWWSIFQVNLILFDFVIPLRLQKLETQNNTPRSPCIGLILKISCFLWMEFPVEFDVGFSSSQVKVVGGPRIGEIDSRGKMKIVLISMKNLVEEK